jgi:hypothetical protein
VKSVSVVYKVSHLTDKEGNPKGHVEDMDTKYIPNVVRVGSSAYFYYADRTDGKGMKTSTVEEVSVIHEMLVVKTMNTVYWFEPFLEGE